MRRVISFIFILLGITLIYSQNLSGSGEYKIKGKKGKIGLIDENKKEVVPFKYDSINKDHISCGWVEVIDKGRVGIYDLVKQEEIIPLEYSKLEAIFQNNTYFIVARNGKQGILSMENRELLPVEYDEIIGRRNYLLISKNNKWGLVTLSGKIIIPVKYDKIINSSGPNFIVSLEEKYGIVEIPGKEMIPLEYDEIKYYKKDHYIVAIQGKYGIINIFGQIIVPLIYDSIVDFGNELSAEIGEKKGTISPDGNFIESEGIEIGGGSKFIPSGMTDRFGSEEYNPDKIYMKVDVEAGYPGGIRECLIFLKSIMEYPKDAQEKGIQGMVMLKFVIEKEGVVSNVKILKDIGGGCGEEAVRILKLTKGWIPAKVDGKEVRSYYYLPIRFELD